MVEPVSYAAASVALGGSLISTINICRKIYKAWKLSESFGEDYSEVARNLQIQWARIETLRRKNTQYLSTKVDTSGEDDPHVRGIINQIINLQRHFRQCDEIVKRNEPKSK